MKEWSETHPWVAVVRAGVDGVNDDDQNGGGQSMVGCGFGVAVHERGRCWWLGLVGSFLARWGTQVEALVAIATAATWRGGGELRLR